MPLILWRLRGSTDKVIECCVNQTASELHAITVMVGHDTFLNESNPNATSARTRAHQVRDRLLKSGRWTLVSQAAEGHACR